MRVGPASRCASACVFAKVLELISIVAHSCAPVSLIGWLVRPEGGREERGGGFWDAKSEGLDAKV